MIIFLYGPDDYRRLQKKNEAIDGFKRKRSALGLGYFDGEKKDALSAVTEFSRSMALFESEKLAVLDNAFECDAEKLAAALKPLASVKNTTVLISEREKPVKALAFLLKEPVRSEQFAALSGQAWAAFIKAEAKKAGFSLAPDAAQFLAAVHEGNSWALVTELRKLSCLGSGGAPVDKRALDALGLDVAPNYWALVNGLKSIDGRVRLSALEKLFSLNDPPPKIFNIIAAQSGDKAARMAGYDLSVKSGKLDYEEALLDLVLG